MTRILLAYHADATKLIRWIKERGVESTLRRLKWVTYARFHEFFYDRHFDRRFNVDTSYVPDQAFTIASPSKDHGKPYRGTHVRHFPSIMAHLPADLSEYAFVDYGSGKGRALLFASDYNFGRIIGVEYAEELHAVAERNIALYRSPQQKCFNLRSVCADAVEFPIPEEKCVFYLYHPFTGSTLARVLDKIRASYVAKPRKMYLVYVNASAGGMVERVGIFSETVSFYPPGLGFFKPFKIRIFETPA